MAWKAIGYYAFNQSFDARAPDKANRLLLTKGRDRLSAQNFKQDTGQAICRGDGVWFRVCFLRFQPKSRCKPPACNTAGGPPRQGCATEQTSQACNKMKVMTSSSLLYVSIFLWVVLLASVPGARPGHVGAWVLFENGCGNGSKM